MFESSTDRRELEGSPKLSTIDSPAESLRRSGQGADVMFLQELVDPVSLRADGVIGDGVDEASLTPCGGEVPPVIDAHVGEEPALAGGVGAEASQHRQDRPRHIQPVDHVQTRLLPQHRLRPHDPLHIVPHAPRPAPQSR